MDRRSLFAPAHPPTETGGTVTPPVGSSRSTPHRTSSPFHGGTSPPPIFQSGAGQYGRGSPMQMSELVADRFIASVEPSAFHGPESPALAILNANRTSSGGVALGMDQEQEERRVRAGLTSNTNGNRQNNLGADEESRSSYRRALKEQMGVSSSVMRYTHTPQQQVPSAAAHGVATPVDVSPNSQDSPFNSFTTVGGGGGGGGGGRFSYQASPSPPRTTFLGTPTPTFPEASPGDDFSPSPGAYSGHQGGFSTPRKRPVEELQDAETLSQPPQYQQQRAPAQCSTPPQQPTKILALHLQNNVMTGSFGPPPNVAGSSMGSLGGSLGMPGSGGGIFSSYTSSHNGGSPTPPNGRYSTGTSQRHRTSSPPQQQQGVSTPSGFRTPIAEDPLLAQQNPTPGGTGSTVAGTSPPIGGGLGVSPLQSPAGGRLSLTGTPQNNRGDSSYHRRRRRLEGSTPLRILNADGISDQCGTSALSWTHSALFICLKNVLYAWSPESVDVVMEVPEPSITSVSASDVSRGQHTYVALGTENGLVHVFMMLQVGVPLQPTFMEGPDGQLIEEDGATPSNRIQWHFMITEHMTRCTATDIHGDRLATGSAEGVLLLTDLKTQLPQHRLTVSSSIMCIKYSPRDGSHLAVGTDKGITMFRSSDFLEPTLCFTEGPVKCLSWNPHGLLSILTYAVGSMIHFYSPGSGDKGFKDIKAAVTGLGWSVAAPELIIGHGSPVQGMDGEGLQHSIGIYDGADTANDGSKLRLCSVISGHRAPAYHVALEPRTGSSVVTGAGGEDSTLRFWALYPEGSAGAASSVPMPTAAATVGGGGVTAGGVELFPGGSALGGGGVGGPSGQRSTYVDCYDESLR